ncbi:universal stress protein [Hydrogenophaga sp.]|uniref:universal stress protein n=1 Tax=Hydrogenophaga sp. TaxID=1904254 RepID=UPI0025C6B4B0|nr:universal stress protein [Hydrogenophaga sp.]
MTPIKSLLAATDFSELSRLAADRAARLAGAAGARLRLVHAVSGSALAQLEQLLGLDTAVEARLIEQARQALESLAAELRAVHGVAVDTTLLQGAVLEQITQEANRVEADIVVVGARGTGFVRHFLLGSTAERLLRKSVHPMLVVKKAPRETYRRVLVPVDFSAWSAPLIDLARAVAPGAHLVLLNAYEVPFEGKLRFASVSDATIESYRAKSHRAASLQLQALAADAGLQPADWTPCIPHADPSQAIVEHEQACGCDLIVIGKQGQTMTEELLLGSVTKHVLVESVGDVLVATLKPT